MADRSPTHAAKSWVAAAALAGAAACPSATPPPTSEPTPQSVSVIAAVDVNANATADAAPKKGMGWYPNVAVDADNRLHFAYVDADKGDVLYARSVAGGSALDGAAVAVDVDGAVGAFLQLALAPGGAPVFSYARQDEGVLRVAWRPADRGAMKAAGADVDVGNLPILPKASRSGAPIEGAAGVIVEEIGFGDQIGRGSRLIVDERGRFALAYFTSDDRLRLARRPADVPAFGGAGLGVLEKRDLDLAVSSTLRLRSDAVFLSDGTLAVAYAHDVVTDARLRVALLPPAAPGKEVRPVIVNVDDDRAIASMGLSTALAPRADGNVDVAYADSSAKGVFVRTLDTAAARLGPAQKLFDVEGPIALARRPLSPGTPAGYVGIARVQSESGEQGGGVFVYVVDEAVVDGAVRYDARRIRVDGGRASSDPSDPWLDIAVRPDGRIAAVWFDRASSSLKLYAP